MPRLAVNGPPVSGETPVCGQLLVQLTSATLLNSRPLHSHPGSTSRTTSRRRAAAVAVVRLGQGERGPYTSVIGEHRSADQVTGRTAAAACAGVVNPRRCDCLT